VYYVYKNIVLKSTRKSDKVRNFSHEHFELITRR